jgi:uncharacterized protein
MALTGLHADWRNGSYLALGIFFLLIIAGNTHAASFDCGNATSEVEKLICGDPLLSKSDDDLAALYAKTLKQAADPSSVKKQQRDWLRNVRDGCSDVSCLREAYATRTRELLSIKETLSRQKPKPMMSDAEACQLAVAHANSDLPDNLVPPEDTLPEIEELERIFDTDIIDDPLWTPQSYWHLDLNDDGIPDHLVIGEEGTAHVSYGLVRSGKKGALVQGVGGEELDLSVLDVGGRYYVLSHNSGRWGSLWRLAENGEFKPMCKFTPRKEPVAKLIAGKESPVCSAAQEGRIQHVSYGLMHELRPLRRKTGLLETPVDGLARVDIDNDGTPDNVVRIDFSRPGGRGCEGGYIAVTDDTGANILDTELNKLLSKKAECDSRRDVFVHEGIAYVDVQGDTGNRSIYLIKGEKAEKICEFCGHLIYDVADFVKESKE